MKRLGRFLLHISTISLAAAPVLASEMLTLDPAATKIQFKLEATGHDVEGSFQLVNGEITFDPATKAASGELRIDATKAETGNKKRDETMHEKVLESPRYPLFLFRAQRVEGALAKTGKSELSIVGTVTVHGADHPLALPATVTVDGNHVSAVTTFSIPFVAWGMEDPSFLFFRVAKEVQVTVNAEGRLAEL